MIEAAKDFEAVDFDILSTFLAMDSLAQKVLPYSSLPILLDEHEAELKSSIDDLCPVLLRYFDQETDDENLLAEIEKYKASFLKAAFQFLASHHIEFVKNFFAIL